MSSPEIHTTKVFIQGMTCAACEQRIGKALKRIPDVQQVKVSSRKGQAIITSTEPIPGKEIATAVRKAGYRVGRTAAHWFTNDRKVWTDVAIAMVAVVFVLLLLNQFGWLGFIDSLTRNAGSGNLVFVILLGVAASLSTCMALAGGVVISLSASFAASFPNATTAQRLRPQLMFNIGRIVGFGLLGAGLGAVGSAFTMSGPVLAVLMVAVAVIMGLLGVRLTGVSPRLAGASFTLPPKLAEWTEKNSESGYCDWTGLGLGVATFFLPCAFTQAVQVYALSTGSPLEAGLTMALFAVGTTPGLLAVGSFSTLIKTDRVFRYVGVVVIAFAILNFAGAVNTILPSSNTVPVTTTTRSDNVTDSGEYQLAKVVVGGANGYTPSDTVVYAGEPVKWTLESNGFSCASVINASQLGFNEIIFLDPGETVVDFKLESPGVYRYSCGMGMYTGTITAIEH